MTVLSTVFAVQSGKVFLPDIHITDSSEALLSGRKPLFRLCVRAMHKDGRALNIRHAVSEGFVVGVGTMFLAILCCCT